uniref:Condensin complex subunit 2 n=1 Tax=Plectus sambesii TaxID=2011161 RepID=A0A914UR96_9BILA
MVTSNPSEEIEQEEIGLCQALSDFDFRSWKADDCLPSSSQDISQSSVFRTDVDANCSVDLSDHDGVHDDVMMVVDENEPADDGPEPEEAHLLRQPRRTTRLQNVIADPQQQDLSYFDQSKMNALKGPDHWKIANGRKPKPEQPKRRVNKAARLKARAAKIELDDSDPEDNLTLAEIMRLYNNVGERKVTLSVEAQKANKAKKQFDAVAEYDATVLARLGLRPEVTVSRRPSSAPCLTDDGTDNYNYENANDSVNFCAEPRAQSAPPEAAPITEETVLMASQESLLEDDTVADTTVDDYDEPCQSQTLPLRPSAKPVPYAKTQKKIDARGLKRAMKKIIGGKGPTQSQSQSSSQDP